MPTISLPGFYIDDVQLNDSADTPVLINRDPEPDESQVPVDTAIGLEIVDVGLDGIDRGTTDVFINGVLAFDGGALPEFQTGFNGVESSVVETADTLAVTIDPATNFASQASITVRVVTQTVGGGNLLDMSYTFQIEDRTAPILLSAQAVGPRTIRLTFDEPIRQLGDGQAGDGLTSTNYAFAIQTRPAVSIVPVNAVSNSPTKLDVLVDIEMSQGALYEALVTNVEDLFGNAIGDTGNRATFTGFVPPARPAQRNFQLIELLPAINRQRDDTGDLRAFIACLQDVFELLISDIDRFAEIFDPDRAPERFVDLMLADLGNPFPFALSILQKRRLVALLLDMYRQIGTAAGIRNVIRFFLGIDVTAVSAYHATTLLLGVSELGIDWELGPDDRAALYSFDVEVDQALTDEERAQIRRIVDFMKPAHTHFRNLIEPGQPAFIDHWELGISELGDTSILHGG